MTDRLFVAVTPPPAVVDALETLVGPRRDMTPPWRWLASRTWHVTLAFLGDVDGDRQDALGDLLADVARTTAPFRLAVAGGRAFPNPRAAKAVVLAGSGGVDDVSHLAQRVRAACSRAGVPPDGARFSPHLTLARCGRGASARALLEIADSFGEHAWDVDGFSLFSSVLAPSGAQYTPLRHFGLDPNPPNAGAASST